jgi:DNA-binding NarL/FixJ family response regulator
MKAREGLAKVQLNSPKTSPPVRRDRGGSNSARSTLERPRLLLADDNQQFRATTAQFLQAEFEVVKTFGDGHALLEEVGRLKPDAVLLDISMPVLNGIEAAQRLKATGNRAKVIFLTMHQDPDHLHAGLAAGALGYVAKSRLASDLLPALREALAGRPFVSPCISQVANDEEDPQSRP